MKLNRLSPVLYTKDIAPTVNFYVTILGFSCNAGSVEWGWANLVLNEVEVMISKPNDHIPFEKPAFSGSFYIHTEGVDELWEKLRDKVNVCYPVENFDYGMREFAIYDNNGYLLQFGEEITSHSS